MPDAPQPARSQAGQGLIEYAMILILVAMVVLLALTVFGAGVGNVFSNVIETL